ncbi:hypothetical protein SAMN05216311_11334, partial [Chitinophaga sp. CF418]
LLRKLLLKRKLLLREKPLNQQLLQLRQLQSLQSCKIDFTNCENKRSWSPPGSFFIYTPASLNFPITMSMSPGLKPRATNTRHLRSRLQRMIPLCVPGVAPRATSTAPTEPIAANDPVMCPRGGTPRYKHGTYGADCGE